MMNGGHWDLQRRLMALLSASDLVWRGGVTRVLVVFEKWHVKVASEEGDNETAGLVITMGHGEGREQAGSVDGVQMGACEQSYRVKFRPKYPCFAKTNVHLRSRCLASRPAHRASWGVGGARSWGDLGRSEVVTRYNLRSDTTSGL